MTRLLLIPAIALLASVSTAAMAAPEDETSHVVGAGETLNGIANRAGVSRDAIIEANGLKAPYMLRAGQKLAIPRGKTARRTIPARTTTTASSGLATYVVKPGETLGGIANREGVPRVLIAEANRLQAPYTLKAGQKLMIPRTRHHVVKQGETGFSVAMDYGVPWKNIAIANGLAESDTVKPGQKLLIPTIFDAPAATPVAPAGPASKAAESARFAWPASGDLRRKFDSRAGAGDYHDGIDIVAAKGSAARAADAGTVIFAEMGVNQFGGLVIVDHGDGWHTAYGSLEKVTVKKGDKVGKTERVGLIGNTSVTGKTELHFEMRKDGKPVDPLTQLP